MQEPLSYSSFPLLLHRQSAFFTALAVIVVPLLDAAFKGKPLGLHSIASVLLAIGGVALLQLGPSLFASVATPVWSTGDWWCLTQAIFFGVGYWRLESASLCYPDQSPRIIAGQLVAISLAAVAYWLVVDMGGSLSSWSQLQSWLFSDPLVWQIIVWTGLITTALAHYLETVALRVVAATELTIIMTSISLWGSAFSYITIGEVMTPVAIVGGLCILGGCLLTTSKDKDSANISGDPTC